MNQNLKIDAIHLKRQAIIYVRQSSVHQVENHQESKKRQYSLKDKALSFGWTLDQILTIDGDLGISGAHSENRPGYQKLISLVALQKVGIIFGIEVSRLTRNCLDWYQLLELASTFNTLIADEDSIFNPANYNDRLLLGLKGTISEAELYQIKCRMMRGRINKAMRGELEISLPIGYEWDMNGKIIKTPDRAIRTAIESVFSLFRQLLSVRRILLEFRKRNCELPYQKNIPGLGRQIKWKLPTYDGIYAIIQNAVYAGVYVYGKRKSCYDQLHKKRIVSNVKKEDIQIYIPNHHEQYITLEEHEENLRIMKNNYYACKISQGAIREGSALLQGIVYCEKCGLKMRPRYTSNRYYYCCDRDQRRYGDPICGWANAMRVDMVIEELIFSVLNEGTVDLTFQMKEKYEEEKIALCKQWKQKIERLEYEANVARRRYESVDSENRLVAATLEAEWNEKLKYLQEAKAEFNNKFNQEEYDISLSSDEVKNSLKILPDKWITGALSMQDKKEIIRCIIERVFIKTAGKTLKIKVNWYGGKITEKEIPKYILTNSSIYYKIVELAKKRTDGEIANILNKEGILTMKQKIWTARRVMDFRLSNNISSGFTTSSKFRLSKNYVTSKEAAAILGVSVMTIQTWFRLGILKGRQRATIQSQLWIYLDKEVIKKLDGTTEFDSTIKAFRSIMRDMKLSRKEIVQWAKENGHEFIRLRRGKTTRFYVLPSSLQESGIR